MEIFIVILLSLMIASVLLLIISANNKLECYFFYHKEWILWEKVIKNFDKKKFCYKYHDGTILYEIIIDGIRYEMYYWNNKSTSLHTDHSHICCYDKYHQEKVRELFEKELSN